MLGGIPASVDLRGSWVGVRDQGSRPTCLACAGSDGHSAVHRLNHRLSAEYLFYHGAQQMPLKDHSNGLTFEATNLALNSNGQPTELDWPYQATHPSPWIPPSVKKLWFGGLSKLSTVASIFDAVNQRIPVVIGVRLVSGFNKVQKAPHIIDPSGPAVGGHAVLAVGIGRRPSAVTDDLLMIRNSWGFSWGEGGHAWLPVEYLKDKLIGCHSPITSHNK
ncbi:MAG: C1 family peptidase [Sulfuritalea sp.]|nr:C1 family peptidase [Sulfuritalea sp.]MDP1983282.1 C1 family peptidase [Sulfuritalea sp.]